MFMRFLIHGFYGAANAGDDAILQAIIDQILLRCPDAEIDVIVRSKILQPYFGTHRVGTISGFDLTDIYHAVAQSDIVIVGGGGLFQDYSGFSALQLFQGGHAGLSRQGAINYYSTPIFLAKTLGKPVYLYGLGIGPFHTAEAARATAWICGLADVLTVRDQGSYDLLRQLGVERAELTADPAVRMGEPDFAGNAAGSAAVTPEGAATRHGGTPALLRSDSDTLPTIGLNLREWTYAPEEGRKVRQALLDTVNQLVRERGAKLKVFPFNRSKREVKLAEDFMALLPAGSAELSSYEGQSPMEMKRQFGELDLVIAMRLHACILSLSAGTPAIGLSYDPKVTQFYAELRLPELCVDIREADSELLHGKAQSILADGALWRERASALMAPLRKREERNGDLLGLLMKQVSEGGEPS
jgi:polysaccharide pyruvyl transferase CsaB